MSRLHFTALFAAAAFAGTLAFTGIASGESPLQIPAPANNSNKRVIIRMSAMRQELRNGYVRIMPGGAVRIMPTPKKHSYGKGALRAK